MSSPLMFIIPDPDSSDGEADELFDYLLRPRGKSGVSQDTEDSVTPDVQDHCEHEKELVEKSSVDASPEGDIEPSFDYRAKPIPFTETSDGTQSSEAIVGSGTEETFEAPQNVFSPNDPQSAFVAPVDSDCHSGVSLTNTGQLAIGLHCKDIPSTVTVTNSSLATCVKDSTPSAGLNFVAHAITQESSAEGIPMNLIPSQGQINASDELRSLLENPDAPLDIGMPDKFYIISDKKWKYLCDKIAELNKSKVQEPSMQQNCLLDLSAISQCSEIKIEHSLHNSDHVNTFSSEDGDHPGRFVRRGNKLVFERNPSDVTGEQASQRADSGEPVDVKGNYSFEELEENESDLEYVKPEENSNVICKEGNQVCSELSKEHKIKPIVSKREMKKGKHNKSDVSKIVRPMPVCLEVVKQKENQLFSLKHVNPVGIMPKTVVQNEEKPVCADNSKQQLKRGRPKKQLCSKSTTSKQHVKTSVDGKRQMPKGKRRKCQDFVFVVNGQNCMTPVYQENTVTEKSPRQICKADDLECPTKTDDCSVDNCLDNVNKQKQCSAIDNGIVHKRIEFSASVERDTENTKEEKYKRRLRTRKGSQKIVKSDSPKSISTNKRKVTSKSNKKIYTVKDINTHVKEPFQKKVIHFENRIEITVEKSKPSVSENNLHLDTFESKTFIANNSSILNSSKHDKSIRRQVVEPNNENDVINVDKCVVIDLEKKGRESASNTKCSQQTVKLHSGSLNNNNNSPQAQMSDLLVITEDKSESKSEHTLMCHNESKTIVENVDTSAEPEVIFTELKTKKKKSVESVVENIIVQIQSSPQKQPSTKEQPKSVGTEKVKQTTCNAKQGNRRKANMTPKKRTILKKKNVNFEVLGQNVNGDQRDVKNVGKAGRKRKMVEKEDELIVKTTPTKGGKKIKSVAKVSASKSVKKLKITTTRARKSRDVVDELQKVARDKKQPSLSDKILPSLSDKKQPSLSDKKQPSVSNKKSLQYQMTKNEVNNKNKGVNKRKILKESESSETDFEKKIHKHRKRDVSDNNSRVSGDEKGKVGSPTVSVKRSSRQKKRLEREGWKDLLPELNIQEQIDDLGDSHQAVNVSRVIKNILRQSKRQHRKRMKDREKKRGQLGLDRDSDKRNKCSDGHVTESDSISDLSPSTSPIKHSLFPEQPKTKNLVQKLTDNMILNLQARNHAKLFEGKEKSVSDNEVASDTSQCLEVHNSPLKPRREVFESLILVSPARTSPHRPTTETTTSAHLTGIVSSIVPSPSKQTDKVHNLLSKVNVMKSLKF